MPPSEIGSQNNRTPPPDILANVDDNSSKAYDRLVYVMGCPGLRDLSREIEIPEWKIETCHDLRLRRRQGELSD